MDETTKFSLAIVLDLDADSSKWQIMTLPGTEPRDISIAQAESIARVFGDILGHDVSPTPFEIVRGATVAMRQKVKRKLAQAELHAAQIAGYRRTLQELGEDA